MTYQLGYRKEFFFLIRLHQLLQPISKSRKSYLKDTTDFIKYIFLKRRSFSRRHKSLQIHHKTRVVTTHYLLEMLRLMLK